MSIDIITAVQELGMAGTWYGPLPSSVNEITDEYLNQQVQANGFTSARLLVHGGTLTASQIKAKVTELQTSNNAADIKRKANKIILERFPEWKQRNYIARALELTNVVAAGGTLTTEESAEIASLQALWDWVKQVRDASDAAEAANTIVSAVSWPPAP